MFHAPSTSQIYTLSLHDALPISKAGDLSLGAQVDPGDPEAGVGLLQVDAGGGVDPRRCEPGLGDRKSTRLNSSHLCSSYAVFCLIKKNKTKTGSNYSPCQ